uniref:Serine-threonine/tyrosine-protein kinase catalytic domain-containing protein n=1 Tax=Aegilops tauschii TaxID=37682 RepID=N1R1Z2_AEGTA
MGDYGDGGGARYSEPPGSFFIGIKGRCPLRLINRLCAQNVNTAEDMERVEPRVALWCIEPNPLLRPTIHQVVQILETNDGVKVRALPDPPDCYMESSPLTPQLRME